MKITSLLLAGVVLVGSAAMAVAQPAGGGRGIPECKDDMAKFCADKTGPDMRQCRMDNMSKFSDACQAAIKARAAAGGGAAPAPAP